MGCLQLGKVSAFDSKLLQIESTSKISVIKCDLRKKEFSNSNLNIHQIEHIPKNDKKQFFSFLSKFDALQELNLDEKLDDGNPKEIRNIHVNKKISSKKNNHVKFSKTKNSSSNKHLNFDKIKKAKKPKRKQFSCGNVRKRKIDKIDNLKERSNSDKISEFILNVRNYKNSKNLKLHHQKHDKSIKNKNNKRNPLLSTIKSKKFNCDNELNNKEDI